MTNNSKEKRSIDYTSFDFTDKLKEFEAFLRETETFKDYNIEGSNIRVLMEMLAMLASQHSFYIQATANEVFQPTAKLYKSLNKIGQTLRYNARGKTSATVNVIGSLNPEYVFGKITQYIEIPSYSIFPSEIPTSTGENFIFTNTIPIVYIIKGFGIRTLQEEDIRYKGYRLPITAPKTFFSVGNLIRLESKLFNIPLSLTKPLTIIKRNTPDNYRVFDTDNFPLVDRSDNESVGQPFNRTIFTNEFGTLLEPNKQYALIFNFDTSSASPYLNISEINNILSNQEDNVICLFSLKQADPNGNLWTLSVDELKTHNRFFIGVLGLQNLEYCKLEIDSIPSSRNSVERLKLVINKDGNSPPLSVLVNGKVFTFQKGTIYSQKISPDFWDASIEEYNVNLSINNENSPETNYGAQLIITSQPPLVNQVTIAKINTRYVDPLTNTKTLETKPGRKYGDIKFVEKKSAKKTEQKAGRIFFQRGEKYQKVLFDSPFVQDPNEDNVSYVVNLTPDGNVRTWITEQNEKGFTIYIEPDTQFEGYVSWVATRFIKEQTKSISIVFDQPVPQSLTPEGKKSNYMVQLTPSDNVEVWYENLTPEGFTIRTEKEFNGRISWSIFNYYGLDTVPPEANSAYRQYGSVIITPEEAESGVKINLETAIVDEDYAIQLIPNKNVVVYYNDKSATGFTIKCEPTKEIVKVDWYVDASGNYSFQKHGEIDFSGSTSSESQIPGLYFINIPETFEINNLIQGSVTFSYINENTVIDASSNGLKINIDPTRIFESDLRLIVNEESISINSIRVFVKNKNGVWEEWRRAGTGFDEDVSPGNQIFFVRVNPEKKIQIEFGDGVHWGESALEKEMFILGLKSVGKEGNISKNVLSKNVILSQYILGSDITNIHFEKQFLGLLGLKTTEYFQGRSLPTQIIDSENTRLKENDLIIIQNESAVGGNEVETTDEIRQNLTNSFIRQDRNVSLLDYEKYLKETFNSYLQDVVVLSYEDAKREGLIKNDEKYWFNHIFIIALNKDGSNVIPRNLKSAIAKHLEGRTFSMLNVKHEIFEATWVPIDVVVRYRKSKFGSAEQVEAQIRKNIQEYFHPSNHSLGAKISHSNFVFLSKVDYVESVEVMLNKDKENRLNIPDYDVQIRQGTTNIDISRRNKIMALIAKDSSLIKVFQPIINSINEIGEIEWTYSLDITLKKYEFPKLGDIIVKREA